MITGQICDLRSVKISDAKEILNWRTSKSIQRNFPSKVTKNMQKHLKWIKKIIWWSRRDY